MKIVLIIAILLIGLFIVFQIYTFIATSKSETQGYKVVRVEKLFEIRYYPTAILAKISISSQTYRDLGNSGFGILAKYIFGGNRENKQIAMTSPVHMEIGHSISTMAFVMPSKLNWADLPKPNNADVVIATSEPEYVAVIRFGVFSNASNIEKHKIILEKALKDIGLTYFGNFRFLGYNPPYQLFGRRNEVIVALNEEYFKSNKQSINNNPVG